MKASKSSIVGAIERPDPNIRFYLFCGQDQAQCRALAAQLLQSLGASKAVISSAALKDSPGSLADEAAALSLFGERRLLWIEPASNDITAAVESLLNAETVESPVVGIAGALQKTSPLLKIAEGSPHALALTTYAPTAEEAVRVIEQLGRQVGLTIAAPVAARLADACGNDQAIASREVEKLAIYLGASTSAPKPLDHDALDAVGAGTGQASLQRLTDLALSGDIRDLSDALAHMGAGIEAVPTLRALQRRLLMLAPARARVERGETVDAVMTSLGKAVFFKEKAAVARMLRAWSAEELARAADRIGTLERDLMFSEVPEQAALEEELLAITRKARSRAI